MRRTTKHSENRRTAARSSDSHDAAEGAPSAAGGVASPAARHLDALLRALSPSELAALMERVGVRVDANKRIDAPAQAARALVRLPDIREPSRLPTASEGVLRRLAEAGGVLIAAALPAGCELLVRRGLVFARIMGRRLELILPTAFLVQLRSWEGEDPRSLRALLCEAPFETASAIASHYLGRPSTPPLALSLEAAWEVLGSPDALRAELQRISHQERRLLEAVEEVGGEVDTQELMELEREPMRVRGVYGVAAGRRGAAFSLEKRGFLFPLHPNRYVVPSEVAAIVGEERRAQQREKRREIHTAVVAADYLPRRARFSSPPGPWAMALTLVFRESGSEVRPGVGTPRSLLARLGQRFGREPEPTALVVSLLRAVGLWDDAIASSTPPGSLSVDELSRLLFDTWRRGGAWDEARADAETLRVAADLRDPSPAAVVREMVLGALRDLDEGVWLPGEALTAYIAEDPRGPALQRLFARWASRVGLQAPDLRAVAGRILLESLPALGVLDVGGDEQPGEEPSAAASVRLTSRGRAWLTEAAFASDEPTFAAAHVLSTGGVSRVADVVELGGFCDVASVGAALDLSFSAPAIARGLAGGIEASAMLERIGRLAAPPASLRQLLEHASAVVGRATLMAASAFLWVDDPEIRDLLRSRPATAELFLDPSPAGGLLVSPMVDYERLVRRCRSLGVEVEVDAGQAHARHSSMPPPKRSDTNRRVSWRPADVRTARERS